MKAVSQILLFVALAGLVWAGCAKPATPKEPMANPPAFGSSADLSNAKGFLAGKWGVEIYMDLDKAAKLPGMEAIVEDFKKNAKDQKIEDVFNFRDDGTFRLSGATWGHKVEGSWKEEGASIMLTYDKLDDKPYQDRMAEIQKASESGTQASLYDAEGADRLEGKLKAYSRLRLSDDKKFLVFQGPGPLGGVEDNGFRLVRLATPK